MRILILQLKFTFGIEDKTYLAQLQQLSISSLLSGLYPQLHGVVVLRHGRNLGGVDTHIVRAIECHGFVLVLDMPCLGSHCHVTVAGIIVYARALALVHLPVADETLRRWGLGHGTLL